MMDKRCDWEHAEKKRIGFVQTKLESSSKIPPGLLITTLYTGIVLNTFFGQQKQIANWTP